MLRVTFIEQNGTTRVVEVQPGLSLMEAAVRNNIVGILAECGGACSCATCHVYVDSAWLGSIGTKSALEESMLEYAEGVTESSRLSCQVKLTEALDGLVVRIPRTQG